MYHKIRIAIVSLVVITIVMLSSVGTLSYFTDTDGKTNDFMVGNASTALTVYDDISSEPWRELDASNYRNKPLVSEMLIPYYLQATNNGNIPVYQRFRVVIPIALADVLTLKVDGCVWQADPDDGDKSLCNTTNYNVTYDKSVDNTYAEYYIVNNRILDVGEATDESSGWPTVAIEVGDIPNSSSLNEIIECKNNDPNDCSLKVKAYSDIIQTTGFNSAMEAFEGFTETYN